MAGKTVRDVLNQYSFYYRGLSESNRARFEERLAALFQHLDFEPRSLESGVTMEMKVVIASAQVQLTFGLDTFLPRHFNKIVVLPSVYRIASHDSPLIGHVDPKRSIIYLSWQDTKHGFAIVDDAINVALHEFAHWLEVESRLDFSNAHLCELEFCDWRKEAQQELIRIRTNENEFLKDYGGRNILEMFAVSVEAFFEKSAAFKEILPELYLQLMELLNQDPANFKDPVV